MTGVFIVSVLVIFREGLAVTGVDVGVTKTLSSRFKGFPDVIAVC
jgi:hypothetical protein